MKSPPLYTPWKHQKTSRSIYNIFCNIGKHREKDWTIFDPLSANPTKWSNTIKQFIGCCRRKTIISNPLIRTCTCSYQGVRIVSFSQNFAYVLNRWSPNYIFGKAFSWVEFFFKLNRHKSKTILPLLSLCAWNIHIEAYIAIVSLSGFNCKWTCRNVVRVYKKIWKNCQNVTIIKKNSGERNLISLCLHWKKISNWSCNFN